MSAAIPAIPPAWAPEDSLARVEDAAHAAGSMVRQQADGSLLLTCVNPAHEDRVPSLHASWTSTPHGGRTLLHCPACGPSITQEEWADLLGLAYDDLFDDRRWSLHNRGAAMSATRAATRSLGRRTSKLGPLPKRIAGELDRLLERDTAPTPAAPSACEHRFDPVVVYPYRGRDGAVVQQVTRLVCSACGQKTFRQSYRAERGGWQNHQPEGFAPTLYRHQEVVAALDRCQDVWLVEGEKDADAAARAGVCSTTNARGGAHFPAELLPVFAGGHVSVVLDRDDTGWQRGVSLHAGLLAAGAVTVRILLPAVDQAKADLSDHLAAGHTLEELLEVPVQAVAAWAGLAEIRRCVARLDQADGEARAQLEVAEHDTRQGRRAKAGDRRRYATRWAREEGRIYALLQAATVKVRDHVARVPGDRWAEQALQIADAQLQAAASLARSTHELVGIAVPQEMQPDAVRQLVQIQATAAARSATPAAAVAAGAEDAPGAPALQVLPGGGDGGGTTRWMPGVHIIKDRYEAINGEIVQVRTERRGRGEDTEWVEQYHRVINKVIRITRVERAEADEDLEREMIDLDSLGDRDGRTAAVVQALPKITHVVFGYEGRDGAQLQVRVPHEEAESGTWLSHLAEPGLDYPRTRAGREKAMTAIHQISDDFEQCTSYRATGWRHTPDGWMYITADGAITADGFTPEMTNLTGPMARFTWPNPITDPARLRSAFLGDSAGMLDRFPDRVGAVLCGHAYRTVLCPDEWVTVLSASPGVGKTGLASLTMHHFGELWDRHRPMSSMSGNGATFNAIRLLANQAKDATFFADDNAPTAGVDQAWKRLEEFIRLISNQEARPRSERDGQGVLPGTRPRTSALVTTELPPRAGTSGERRALIVPLNRDDVDVEDIKAMDSLESRHGRALLIASYLQWLAGDLRAFLARAATLREEFIHDMLAVPGHPRSWDRHATKVAELWAGWGLMLEFLTERGALSDTEAQQWRTRIRAALHVAAESCEDPDLVTCTGERVVELLRHALDNGLAVARDIRTGQAPTGLEQRLGWQLQPSRGVGTVSWQPEPAGEWRADPRAVLLGYVNLEGERELVCTRAALEAVLKSVAQTMADTSAIDLGTVLRALEDEGVLKVQHEKRPGGSVCKRTLARTIWAQSDSRDPSKPLRATRVVLRLDQLLDGPAPGDDTVLGAVGDDDVPPSPTPVEHTPAGTTDPQALSPAATAPQGEEQEAGMGRQHTNAGGLVLQNRTLEDPQPCVRCGIPSSASFDRIPLHLPCFWATTSSTTLALHREIDALRQPAAVAHEESQSPTTGTPAPTQPPQPKRPRVPRAAGTAQTATAFRASVAVVDVDAAWLPDGTRVELETPVEHLGHLEQIGRGLGLGKKGLAWRRQPFAGLVVPTPALWKQLGVDITQVPQRPSKRREWLAQLSTDLPALSAAVQQGWVFGRGDRAPQLHGLTRLRRAEAEYGQVAVLFSAGMPAEWGLDAPAPQLARRLELFCEAVGIPFSGSPITTGIDLLKIVLPREVREALDPAVATDYSQIGPAAAADLEAQFDWTRVPAPSEATKELLALYDRGGSYLGTWSSLLLGLGDPELLEGEGLRCDPKRAGWWLVTVPPRQEGERDPFPDILDPQGNRAGQQVWVTTPVLEYATAPAPQGLGLDVEVHRAWAWPADRSKRVLEPLYKVLRDGLNQLRELGPDDEDAKAAAALVKQIYKQLSGHFVSANSDPRARDEAERSTLSLHQPYWYHAMRGAARKAILHQIRATGTKQGVWPVVVSNNDAIGYLVDGPDLQQAWPGDPAKYGYGLGQYKAARWARTDEHLQFLTGAGWSGRDATITVDEGLPGQETL